MSLRSRVPKSEIVSAIWKRRKIFRTVISVFDLAWFVLDETMKTVVTKVKRSGIYYLITTIASVDDSRNARRDTWGVVGVIVLLLGVAGLMRLVLSV